MIVHHLFVALAALGAACCFAVSNVIEQRKAAQAPAETALRPALLWHLAHQPIWWLAILVDAGGYGLQVLALALGTVVFVQPLIVSSLVLSLVFGAAVGSHVLSRADLAWAGLFVVSLSGFLIAANPGEGVANRPFDVWLWVFVALGVVIAVCVVASRRRSRRALALATGAGVSFGVSSALTKGFADRLGSSGLGVFAHWEVYALAVVLTGGFLLMQSAFQAGDLRAALPAVELGEPVIAGLLGVVVLHESLDVAGPFAVAVLAVTVAGMALSAARLAHSAARSTERNAAMAAPGRDAARDATSEVVAQRPDTDA